MRLKIFILIGIFCTLFFLSIPVSAQEHTGDIIVKFKNNTNVGQAIGDSIKSFNDKVDKDHFTVSNFKSIVNNSNSKYFSSDSSINKVYKFRNNKVSLNESLQMLRKMSVVDYAEPDYTFNLSAIPNDADYGKQWHLSKMSAPQAWDKTTGSHSIIVAVIDSGVDYNHPDLSANMWRNTSGHVGYDFGENDNDPMDVQGHGTHMAGVIGAVGNNNNGVTGINWNVKIMAVKAVGTNAVLAPSSTVASSIIYAADNGARVINMSFGAPGVYSQTVANAIEYAYSKNVILVSSAGNYVCPVWFPANHPKVIAAGATDQNDNHPGFSCEGDALDLTAPSVNIISTEKGGGYTTGQNNTGTSYSAAMVSGAAALVLASQPSLSNTDVINRLQSTADDLGAQGRDNTFGYGRINLARAVGVQGNPYPTRYPTQPPQACTFKLTAVTRDQHGNILHNTAQGAGLSMNWNYTTQQGTYVSGTSYFTNGKYDPEEFALDNGMKNALVNVTFQYNSSNWNLQNRTYCSNKTSSQSCSYAQHLTVKFYFVCGGRVEYGWHVEPVRPVEPMPTILYPTPTVNPPQNNQLSVYTSVGEGAQVQIGQIIKVCYTVPRPGKFTFSRITNTWTRNNSYYDDGRGDCFVARIANPAGRHTYRIEMSGEVRETYVNVIPCTTPNMKFSEDETTM